MIRYFPQLGCLMALPFNERLTLEQQIRIEGLQYQVHEYLAL